MNNRSFQELRIVFMGTPEFAVASLDRLFNAGCNIVGVITAPDKPAGRGMNLRQSPVKIFAISKGIPVLQPEKLKDPAFLEELKGLQANLQICVAFRMLPEQVWNMPPLGTINLHGSLLPQYRGAAPINWAVMNGEKETGVTTFKLKHDIDTGNILLQKNFPILEDDTAGTVHDKMKEIGADLLLETVKGLASGSIVEKPQPLAGNEKLKPAPKIFTETCQIDFSKDVETVYDHVRGLSPYPTAYTFLDQKQLKIYRAAKNTESPVSAPGEFETDGRNFLKVACRNGYLQLLELQMEGKKRMTVEDFLRGYRFKQ